MYLKDRVNRPLTGTELEENVSDFMLPNGDWNMGKLLSLLPEDIFSEILKSRISGSECVKDTIV